MCFCETNPNFRCAFFSGSVRAIVCYGDGDGFLNRVRLAKTDPISHWLDRFFCVKGMVLGLYVDNASGFVCRRRQRRLLRKYDMQRLADSAPSDSAPVRNAHAHSHYPVGLETTRGGLLRKYDVQ